MSGKRRVSDMSRHKWMIIHQFVFANDVTLPDDDIPSGPSDPERARLVTVQEIRFHE